MEMNIALDLKQGLNLSPQMLQSIEILQMNSMDLTDYIQKLADSNPAVEIIEESAEPGECSEFKRKLDWLSETDIQNKVFYKADQNERNTHDITTLGEARDDSLLDYVLSQINFTELPPDIKNAAVFIAESMDSNGYIDETPAQIAESTRVSLACAKEALRVVRSLDPAGIGAANLQECLKLQLERRKYSGKLAYDIIDSELKNLGKNNYAAIAKSLNAALSEVHAACALIRGLNPRPGSGFSARENLAYITPDIAVVKFQDFFQILYNDYYFPKLLVSGYYKSMLEHTSDSEVREYLDSKIKQAVWVAKCIEQRKHTLLECTRKIVEIQEAFFRNGPGNLVPMSLSDIAVKVSLHESTVSRAVRDKYLQCSFGVYALSYFFSRALSSGTGGTHSPDAIKSRIKKLVASENPECPLSDNEIAKLLSENGVTVSRRTVAKYRGELMIENSAGRRKIPKF